MDGAQRAKQVRFLISRGFSAEVVRRVVAGADDME
jgi:SOS response regulatory protein OraA/RecX